MSGKLRLNGATSGYSELQAPDVAGDQTFTLPAVGASLVGYQQGTIPAAVSIGTINPDSEYQWNRIGNYVFFAGVCTKFTDTTTTGYVDVISIPYPAADNACAGSVMASKCGDVWTTSFMNKDEQAVRFYLSALTGTYRLMQHSDLQSGSGFYFTVTYRTDDTTWIPINGATIS